MKLKWYCGAVHCWYPGLEYQQRHVIVCTTSRKRVQTLLRPLADVSLFHIQGWFSCVNKPPTTWPCDDLKDKPIEESVWIEPTPSQPYVRFNA
jgi:hypothetical protein